MAAKPKIRSLGSSLRDLLILVIGIVLSFTLTEWRQNKADLNEEKRIIGLIYSDLKEDTTNINSNLELLESLKSGFDSILSYRNRPSEADPVQVLRWAYSVVNFVPFDPNRTGYIQLSNHKNSGALKNKKILTSIIGLFNDEYETLNTLNESHKELLLNQMTPKYFSWIPFLEKPTDLNEKNIAQLRALLNDNEFLNMLQFELILKINLEKQYAHSLESIESILQLIETDYGKDFVSENTAD